MKVKTSSTWPKARTYAAFWMVIAVNHPALATMPATPTQIATRHCPSKAVI